MLNICWSVINENGRITNEQKPTTVKNTPHIIVILLHDNDFDFLFLSYWTEIDFSFEVLLYPSTICKSNTFITGYTTEMIVVNIARTIATITVKKHKMKILNP